MKPENHAAGIPDRFPNSKKDYEIITPMMTEAADIILDEVQRMSSGTALYGPPRSGKSRAIRHAISEVRKEFPRVTCVRAVMVSRRLTSDVKFFKALGEDFDLGTPTDGDGDDMRSALVQQFLIQCTETHDSRVLMILDEAQRITISEYSYLVDLTNHLENLGVAPTVILNGQPELMEVRDDLLKAKRTDVVGRFLENPIAFEGITNQADLETVLQQFDDAAKMQYPLKSNQCITAAFNPHLYKGGFRLGNCAKAFWEAIEECTQQLGVRKVIGMHSLTKATEMALVSMASEDNPHVINQPSWWKPILQDSGYLKHLLLFSSQSRHKA